MKKVSKNSDKLTDFNKFAIRKPDLTVLTDHPLKPQEAYSDNFNLRTKLGPVYDIIRHPQMQTPMTIAIYGDWGTGKTTAMRWLDGLIKEWNQNRENRDIRVWPVWFYPWKYDTKESVWRGLLAEVVINSIDVKGASLQRVKEAAKQFGLFLGRSFLHILAGVKLTAKAPGDTGQVELDLASTKEILSEYQEAAHPEKAYLNEFESTLEKWIKNTLGPNDRMVIFIDDLDRCMPEIALQVLEAFKLYLNIEKLIFVVGVDKEVVEKLVVEHYRKLGLVKDKAEEQSGQREKGLDKARNYLAKMFQVEIELGPSEQQIDKFLDDQLKRITYWRGPHLSDDEQKLFYKIILELARTNPREIKRLINSALMLGAGAVMGTATDEDTETIKFNQGLQLFFVQRILDDTYTMGSLVRTKRGIEFFSQWSQIVQAGRKNDKDFPCCIKVPKDFGKEIPKEFAEKEITLRVGGREVSKRLKEGEPSISFAPAEYHPLLRNPRFSGLLHLLADESLGSLMQIPFPAEATQVAAVVGTGKDEEIIRERIASKLGKKPDEITADDYGKITELDLSNTEISDIGPLKALTNLQTLYLYNTQVSDIEPLKALTNLQALYLHNTQVSDIGPLKALTNLQTLWLYNTQVSDKQVAELKQALPKLTIYR